MSRRMGRASAWLVCVLVLASAACPGAGTGARTAADDDDAVVVIRAGVADAELWVDDRFVAHLGRLPAGVRLSPGSHRLEIRHDRYHTHYQELAVEPRQRLTLDVDLAPVLP